MKHRLYSNMLICLLLLASCANKTYYGEISKGEACRYLWNRTNKPWFGSYKKVVELINKGANVEYIDSSRTLRTPFLNGSGALGFIEGHHRLRQGQTDSMEVEAVKIVKYLASKGANIHATSTSRKLNALHLAACGGREKVIPVLVNLGLDINSRDSTKGFGVTPLLHAIAAGDLATVKAIVSAGGDINQCSLDGNSPLDWAMYYLRIKGKTFPMPYEDQEVIVEYMQSIGAKHGKNEFKGMLYFNESKQ